MIDFAYSFDYDKFIIFQEDQFFEKYCSIIDDYSDIFAKYNCSLNVGRIWINKLKNDKSNKRLPFKNGYSCYIYCNLESNNQVVRYYSDDGETDYYEASSFWCISSVSRMFFRLKIVLWTEPNDIDINKDIDQLLKIAQNLENNQRTGTQGDG